MTTTNAQIVSLDTQTFMFINTAMRKEDLPWRKQRLQAYRLHDVECDINHAVEQITRSFCQRALTVADQRRVLFVEKPPGALTGMWSVCVGGGGGERRV